MSTYGEVKTWSATDLEAAADDLVARSARLQGLQDELEAANRTLLWTGQAADAAATAHGGLYERVRRLVAQVGAVRTALDEAGDSVQALRALITEAAFYAARNQFVITSDGAVRDNLPPKTVLTAEENADRTRAFTEICDQIQQTMSTAADVDADVAAVMMRAVHDEIDDGVFPGLGNADNAGAAEGGLTPGAPPTSASPFDNAAWWDSLSEQQQADILAEHPEWVGNLDGIPGAVRSEANLAQLDDQRATLVAREQQLIADLDDNWFGGTFTNADAELADIRAKIASVDAVSKVMAQGDRQLLLLDLSGERAEAAISYGDIDTADHLSVFTPGLNTTVDGSTGSYDEQNRRLNDEATDQLDRNGDGGTVATVTWIGYQAPQAHNPDWTRACLHLGQRQRGPAGRHRRHRPCRRRSTDQLPQRHRRLSAHRSAPHGAGTLLRVIDHQLRPAGRHRGGRRGLVRQPRVRHRRRHRPQRRPRPRLPHGGRGGPCRRLRCVR